MIKLKPEPYNHFICPACDASDPRVDNILFPGMNVLADCFCENCGFFFYHVFPVGHAVDYPIAFGRSDGKFYNGNGSVQWLQESLVKSCTHLQDVDVQIKKKVYREYKHVVVLNTLDFLYGHSLLKLLNAQYHLDKHRALGLIVIVSKAFEWMIPTGCAEAWVVDLNLNDMVRGYSAIDRFVSEEFKRFDTIYLSHAYSHPDQTSVDIGRFTGVAPFDLRSFTMRNPCITFILREDRWWFENRLGYWFYRVCRKLKCLSWGGQILARRQNYLVKKTIAALRKKLDRAEFYVAGLGNTGDFERFATDKRVEKVVPAVEKDWCELYARSHVVIGVHGSNMLLPTAFAAGCVEVLPEDRYGNIIQDLFVRYHDRRQLFFYRLVDQYTSAKSIAKKVTAIVSEYDRYYKNMCRNVYH